MNARHSTLLGLAALLALSGAALADQVYKWVDKDGHVHYSSTPPPGTNTPPQTVNIPVAPPDAYGAKSDQAAINAQANENKQAQADAQKAQAAAQQKQALQKACQAEKDQLQQMQDARRVSFTDDKGNTQYVSGDDRQKAMDDLQARINKDCGAAGQ